MKELFDKKLRDKSFEEGLKNAVKRINPCQGHAFSDEGAESLEELLPDKCIHNEDIWLCHEINKCDKCISNKGLPLKCIHFKDYNLCSCKNICEQCKTD